MGISEGDLTLRAKAALDSATRIIARDAHSESFKSLKGYDVFILSDIAGDGLNKDGLCENIAAEVIKESDRSDVCFCVDGAVCEDEVCKIILSEHEDCEVLDTLSRASAAYSAARLKCGQTVSVSAHSVKGLKSCRAACVYGIDSHEAALNVKQTLTRIFGGGTNCVFVRGGKTVIIKVCEIDSQGGYDQSCAVAVEEGEFLKKERYDFDDLEHIVELLRAPDGCPWDRAQTSSSIKKNMIEEAYELVDAIERGDEDGMEEETGDVLLQAVFHAVLSKERGGFTGADAITRNVKKLIFRHSHIFGGDNAKNEGEALSVWEKNKIKEKGQSTYGETLLAVPKNLPACMRAQKAGKRAAKCGFDFSSSAEASEKLWEEVREMAACKQKGDDDGTFEEAGDVLFSAINTVRLAGVDCEEALNSATDKFIRRFVECEKMIIADGKDIKEITKDGLLFDFYWQKAKNAVK